MNTPRDVSYKSSPSTTPTASTTPAKPLDLFRVRLKDRNDVREVVVAACNITQANDVGIAYCDLEKFRFIRVEPMVVADPRILN